MEELIIFIGNNPYSYILEYTIGICAKIIQMWGWWTRSAQNPLFSSLFSWSLYSI